VSELSARDGRLLARHAARGGLALTGLAVADGRLILADGLHGLLFAVG
jgi:hypothetical protein